ncbi:MAG: sugar phosphate isomerase/epimerase [Chloroflexi bacterium]|nr:sugar phosphate isomerase/epimerase [Chloroflexota bacterium]
MSTGSAPLAKILLKARPTPTQLENRFAPPWPDGLELYLDRADVVTPEECRAVIDRIREHELPDGFKFVVEGPIRSLDNEYVDITACTEATRELIRRLGAMAAELGAEGVVMHCIVPRFTLTDEDWANRERHLESCLEFAQFYADTLLPLGVVPTLENVPPVLRMREGRYLFTPVGMAPEDLRWFLDRVPGLQTTLDVSHGQLYVNAWEMAQRGEGDEAVQPLMHHLRHFAPIQSVEGFIDLNGPQIFEAHVSNASGLLGEGARYSDGDIDMQRVIGRLARTARFLVTETLEPDNDVAEYMREAQEGMASVLESLSETEE